MVKCVEKRKLTDDADSSLVSSAFCNLVFEITAFHWVNAAKSRHHSHHYEIDELKNFL